MDKTCELCNMDTEDREHFILHCTALEEAKNKHMAKLYNVIPNLIGKNEELLQCILDCTHKDLGPYIKRSKRTEEKIEEISRSLLYELHSCRSRILSYKKQDQENKRKSTRPVKKARCGTRTSMLS